jgi:hypothetical protein
MIVFFVGVLGTRLKVPDDCDELLRINEITIGMTIGEEPTD